MMCENKTEISIGPDNEASIRQFPDKQANTRSCTNVSRSVADSICSGMRLFIDAKDGSSSLKTASCRLTAGHQLHHNLSDQRDELRFAGGVVVARNRQGAANPGRRPPWHRVLIFPIGS